VSVEGNSIEPTITASRGRWLGSVSTYTAPSRATSSGRIQGDMIDLEPALRDALVLALPANPLCRDDCPGLCPECGVHWDDLPAGHSHQQVDPRWARLMNLTEE